MASPRSLQCAACGAERSVAPVAVCSECWGPLEPRYDHDTARVGFTREAIADGPQSIARYVARLPTDELDERVGWTPLLAAPRLARALNVRDLWIKYEAACHPTLSFKDRLVAVALGMARQFGMSTVACASTGNLAHALAAGAARAGMRAVVIVPEDAEPAKITAAAAHGAIVIGVRGDYDRANRLSVEIAERFEWGVVNVNLRAFYAEGAKTVGYEIAEQRGWSLPGHVVVPVAGGGLLNKIDQAFQELIGFGLVAPAHVAMHGVQPEGSAPIVDAWREGWAETRPLRPKTRVTSLAIGDPPEGAATVSTIRRTRGRAVALSDDEADAGVSELARTEGLLVEAAGGLVVAAAARLARDGAFGDGEPVVLVLPGHGLKTLPAGSRPFAAIIDGRLSSFLEFWSTRES